MSMARIGRIAFTFVPALLLLVVASQSVSSLKVARDRSRQKRTMSVMRDAAVQIENGKTVGPLKDAWGFPIQVRVSDAHYSLRSAGSDGRFESAAPSGRIAGFEADIVLAEGGFVQFPEGL